MALTKATFSMIVGAPINVADYGAVGDGTTDDTTAITAAITAGGASGAMVVGDPSKTYLVGTMDFVSDGTDLYRLKDLNFKLKASVSNFTIRLYGAAEASIVDCAFDGNKANQSKHSTANVLIWGCQIVNILNSKFHDASYHGCELFKCRNVTVDSSWFYENGQADSAYPADGLMLTIANGTITNNICYLNNTATGGDNIDGDGIQLGRSGSDDAYWTAATDLLQVVRLENNLCYQNGRRGIKDQRGNTEVVANSCWGNYVQLLIAQAETISNFYYAGNMLGRTGDSYTNPLFYVDVSPAPAVANNIVFINNIGNGDITNNDAFRFQGVTNTFIFGNSYTGAVSSPYVVYGFRAPTSDTIYFQKALKDSARTDTVDSTNVWKDKGFVQTLSAAPTTGTWSVGDIVYNSAPTAGQPMGWVCSVAGTPGTWLAMANLT